MYIVVLHYSYPTYVDKEMNQVSIYILTIANIVTFPSYLST